MGFCTLASTRFLHQCPTSSGCSSRTDPAAQVLVLGERRRAGTALPSRLTEPMRRWKLSEMDLQSIIRWEEYSRAKDQMLVHTSIPEAPWYVVESEDKRRARINMISHLLSTLPYHDVPLREIELPHRPAPKGYERPPHGSQNFMPTSARDPEGLNPPSGVVLRPRGVAVGRVEVPRPVAVGSTPSASTSSDLIRSYS